MFRRWISHFHDQEMMNLWIKRENRSCVVLYLYEAFSERGRLGDAISWSSSTVDAVCEDPWGRTRYSCSRKNRTYITADRSAKTVFFKVLYWLPKLWLLVAYLYDTELRPKRLFRKSIAPEKFAIQKHPISFIIRC